MKKIFKYFGVFLSVALLGAAACTPSEIEESADLGLGIKTFFPTKVVAGQPMTINGSGFSDVREIVFPDGVTVTNFELVGGEMIRVTAPSGISAAGGKLIVRSADDEAESLQELSLGKTVISGYSKQDGESITGGEQLTIYGQDLEFISSVELLDPDGNPLILQDEDFYRKGTSSVIITLPRKVFEGTFIGKVYTFDGREFPLPELAYEPASDGGGHWETIKTSIWKNDGSHGKVSWSSDYRFASETNKTGEEIYAIPDDIWAKMKSGTFYMLFKNEGGDQGVDIRITTGWWSTTWTGGDFFLGNERIVDNEDGTYSLAIDFAGDPILDVIDVQHLLLTGDRYTPLELYFAEDVWVEGGGHMEIVKTSLWKGDGSAGAVSWSGSYRFGLDGHDGNNECIATFPQEIWDKLKSETFYLLLSATDPQIRVTTGWWSTTWAGKDFQPGNDERLVDNGDGTWTLEVNLSGDPILDVLDDQHLLFTGDRYTPLEIFFQEEVWVEGEGGPKEVPFWEGDGSVGGVSWNGTYRFGLEGHDGNNECITTLPQDVWDKVKSATFYLLLQATDPQIRVTTGWWSTTWAGKDFQPGNDERLVDNGDGTWTLEVNLSGDPILDVLDDQHLLFTGDRYTPLKLYFLE